jgi:hypothetical protein
MKIHSNYFLFPPEVILKLCKLCCSYAQHNAMAVYGGRRDKWLHILNSDSKSCLMLFNNAVSTSHSIALNYMIRWPWVVNRRGFRRILLSVWTRYPDIRLEDIQFVSTTNSLRNKTRILCLTLLPDGDMFWVSHFTSFYFFSGIIVYIFSDICAPSSEYNVIMARGSLWYCVVDSSVTVNWKLDL